jgi:uncharacterized SAM-binding protein YcdF (DUF218 family)
VTAKILNSGLQPRIRRLCVRGLVLFALWLFVAYLGARFLIVTAPIEHADAIVLLSGSAAYVERASLAAQLFKEGKAPLVILTNDHGQGGWSNSEQRNPFNYELTSWQLQRLGVPQSKIEIILEPVDSTQDEASVMSRYSVHRNLKTIVLVTSAYHSRRALKIFRRTFNGSQIMVGLEAVPPGWQTPSPWTWWLWPRGWQSVAGEYVKFFFMKACFS